MYLEREDLSVYSNIEIEHGISMVSSEPFSFSLALCREISKPEWKLINVKSDCELFSKHLLFSMPHSISAISEFLRVYRVYSRAKEIFQELKRASERIDIDVKGYHKKFEITIHTFRILVHVKYSGINGKLFMCFLLEKMIWKHLRIRWPSFSGERGRMPHFHSETDSGQ